MQTSQLIVDALNGKARPGSYVFPFLALRCLLQIAIYSIFFLVFAAFVSGMFLVWYLDKATMAWGLQLLFLAVTFALLLLTFYFFNKAIYLVRCYLTTGNLLVITSNEVHISLAGNCQVHPKANLKSLVLHTSNDLFFGISHITYQDVNSGKRTVLIKGRMFGSLEEIFRILTNH